MAGMRVMSKDPKRQVLRTKAFVEESGPLFVEMQAKIIKRFLGKVTLIFENDADFPVTYPLPSSWFSYADNYVLQQTDIGSTMNIKVRCDDVWCAREH